MIINLANPKTKKTYTVKIESPVFIGKKLTDSVDLAALNITGKAQITGGSTKTGCPMVPFVEGAIYKKVLLSDGLAFSAKHDGEKKRRTVFGNTISEEVEQVNLKILDIDSKVNLDELFPKQEKKE